MKTITRKQIAKQVDAIQRQIYKVEADAGKEIRKLEKKRYKIWEQASMFSVGDKVRVVGVWVRDYAQEVDLQYLGKTGKVTEIEGEHIDVNFGGVGIVIYREKNLKKIGDDERK